MNASDFQDAADRLVQGATEADWCSAVSRSYYAVFHHFRQFLLSHGVSVGRGGQSHFNLYTGLNNCGFAAVAGNAQRIDNLRSNRTLADYDLARSLTQAEATNLVQEGRTIVQDFQAMLAALSPAQVAAGAKKHLQAVGRIPP
jgi:uncharacterized protein (UPF0332 family)